MSLSLDLFAGALDGPQKPAGECGGNDTILDGSK